MYELVVLFLLFAPSLAYSEITSQYRLCDFVLQALGFNMSGVKPRRIASTARLSARK